MNAPTSSAAPPPFPARVVRRGLRLNILAGSTGMVWVAVALGVPYIMLLEALGASGVLLGLTATVRQIAIVAQLPSAFRMERLRRRKYAWGTLACIHRALWLVPAWLAWRLPAHTAAVNWILGAVIVSTIIENFATPAWYSWMADFVPAHQRGRFWSRRQAAVMTSYMIALAIAGYALDRIPNDAHGNLVGFALVFAVGAVFGVADILIHLGVPEPARRPALAGRSWLVRLVAPMRHPSFRNLAIAIGAWSFACTMAGTFNAVYLKRVFHASYTALSTMTICGSLSVIGFSLFAGYLVDRIGARALAVVTMIVAPLFSACWFFVTDAPVSFTLPLVGTVTTTQAVFLICVISLLSSGFYSILGICHVSLIGALSPKRDRTVAMAVHWVVLGCVGAAGPLVGGAIVDWFTAHPSPIVLLRNTHLNFTQVLHIFHALVIWSVAVPFMLRVRAHREPLNAAEAFDRVIMVNPVRLISGLYHGQVLASPVPRARRRRAVEALGEAGAELAVRDLAAELDDPTADVREAAALALGQIGGADAQQALLDKLDDPMTDLALPLLRALRRASPDLALPRILPRLADPDPAVVREAALTLGALGDGRAVSPLVDLLHRARHPAALAGAAESLGRLGDISAVYVILPRMRTTENPFLRRVLAVACGDLIGEPDAFYRLLMREAHVGHGVAVGEAIQGARRALRRTHRPLTPALRQRLADGLTRLEREYEAAALTRCAATAFELAALLAEARFGIAYPGAVRTFLEAVDRRDPRFTVGAWYLAILDGAFSRSQTSASLAPARDLTELQLAVHVAVSGVLALDTPPSPPRPGVLALTGAIPDAPPPPQQPPPAAAP